MVSNLESLLAVEPSVAGRKARPILGCSDLLLGVYFPVCVQDLCSTLGGLVTDICR